MAKSIRSKWKRKMRNIKRAKNYPKELERLQKTVAEVGLDTVMDGGNEVQVASSTEHALASEKMDASDGKPKYGKYMLDENGQYPIWLTKKQKRKMKSSRLRSKKRKGKLAKKGTSKKKK